MSDDKLFSLQPAAPLDESAREERHRVLIDLLGAYADGELAAETVSQIDAHLVGCPRCRRELSVHESIRGRLAIEPSSAASLALRERISAAVAGHAAPIAPAAEIANASRLSRTRIARAGLIGVVAVALVLAIGVRQWSSNPVPAGERAIRDIAVPARSVPLLAAVLEDYGRVTQGDLPGRARDLAAVRAAVPFRVEPLDDSRLRLLAAWTSDLSGEPAAVLAYRLDDRVVVQYIVSEQFFFRHPAVRTAVAAGHVVLARDGPRVLIGWPQSAGASVLLGDLSPAQLASLGAKEGLR